MWIYLFLFWSNQSLFNVNLIPADRIIEEYRWIYRQHQDRAWLMQIYDLQHWFHVVFHPWLIVCQQPKTKQTNIHSHFRFLSRKNTYNRKGDCSKTGIDCMKNLTKTLSFESLFFSNKNLLLSEQIYRRCQSPKVPMK